MIKWIRAKFQSVCHNCAAVVGVGDSALWSTKGKKALCKTCAGKFIEWKGGTL